MAAKEGLPVETERSAHYTYYMSGSSSGKNSAMAQPHLNDSSSSHISSDLTPLFDREDNHKQPDIVYNDASSSEESEQAAVIFSLDELQNSMTELPSSISPEVSPVDQRNSAGLLFPSLIQDEDEKFSVSSKEDEEESDQNNDEFNLSSTLLPVEDHSIKNTAKADVLHDNVPIDNKVTKCSQEINSVNTKPEPDVSSDDTLLYHINSSVAGVDPTTIDAVPSDVSPVPVTAHPNSLDASFVDVSLDDNWHNSGKLSPTNVSPPQVETPHVETSSDVVTITPIETPTATSHKSLSGAELLSETELGNSVSSSNLDNISMHHEKPVGLISMSGSIASGSGSKSLPDKLKPTQNAFESPGLLYAHPVKKSSKQVVETLEPAEPATEALLSEEKLPVAKSQDSHHVRAKTNKRGEIFIHQTHLPSFTYKNLTGIPLFYPPDRTSNTAAADELLLDDSVLKDVERNARKVAENLDYMLDNLRYSLHAMATCTKLSVSLHKEAVDDMHVTVDDSIKMMYAFLAKFEELNSNMKPIEALAAQIKDVSESLKVLEKAIR